MLSNMTALPFYFLPKERGFHIMSGSTIAILIAFVCYLLLMIGIGVVSMKKTNNTEDYFLGGRGLNGWVAALSAQASDMSGWLLMGLPGSIYVAGTGKAWIGIGLFIGTVLNWLLISKRLRRYTIVANNSLTLPEFFQNRFHDKKKLLLGISSVVIVIFFLVYTASALASGGKLFNTVFGIDYHVSLLIGAAVILLYTFMGGFLAVCTTDFVQGMMMLVGLLVVPIFAYAAVSGDFTNALTASGVTNSGYYLNLFYDMEGNKLSFVSIISDIAWGLGYCGMPHILVRFMAVKSEKELKKSSKIAIVWIALSLFAACFIGVVGRAYLVPALAKGSEETVFISMIKTIFSGNGLVVFIGGLFLCGILAAVMSTADSQLLVCASSVSKDIYKNILKPDAKDKKVLLVTRMTVLVVAVLAALIAWNPDSSIMNLVSDAWAGLGSAFGPLVLCSLFWKRTNLPGAVAGIVSGGLFVIVWDYLPIVGGKTLYDATGIYSLLIGFFLSLACSCFTFLLGGGPIEMLCAFVGAGLGNTLRMKLIKHNYTLFLNVAASVSLACLVYALLFNFLETCFGISTQHEAGYICSMLFIIPGFPFITSGIDLAKLDLRSGLERLAYAIIIILAATLTAWICALVLHLQPVDFVKLHISASTKLLLRLLTSFGGVFGFSIMFNSSKKIAASAGCIGAIANTLRLTLVDLSLPAAASSFFSSA